MSFFRSTGLKPERPRRSSALAGLAAALALSLLGLAAHAAGAAAAKDELSKEDKACLECHARPDQSMTLGNGEKLPLSIPVKAFAASVHASSGCEACHSNIDLASHGKGGKAAASMQHKGWALHDDGGSASHHSGDKAVTAGLPN